MSEPSLSASTLSPTSSSTRWDAPIFVWGVWAVMLLAALTFTVRMSSPYPFGDDWQHVRALTGVQPLSLSWLWSQIGWYHENGEITNRQEHRCILYRLLVYVLGKLGWHDLRALLVPAVLLLGAFAAAAILAARRVRGETAFTDAFFPLVLLHWGHSLSYVQAVTALLFTVPAAVAGLLLVMLVQSKGPLSLRMALWYTGGLVVLFLCGGGGLAFIPPLAAALGYSAFLHWRSAAPDSRRLAGLTLLLALGSLALVLLNFVAYVPMPEDYIPYYGRRVFVLTFLRFLCLGFGDGPTVLPTQPYSGLLFLGLLGVSAVVLTVLWVRRPEERFRTLALLCFLAGGIGLAVVVGWKRQVAPDDPDYASFGGGYYNMYAIPVVIWTYLVWIVYPLPGSRLVQMCLFSVCCALLPLNLQQGYSFGKYYRGLFENLSRDLNENLTPALLADRHWRHGTCSADLAPGYFTFAFGTLKQAGVRGFAELRDEEATRKVKLPLESAELHNVCWEGNTAVGSGADPQLIFTVQPPRRVLAIQLKYHIENTASDRLTILCQRPRALAYTPAHLPPEVVRDPGHDLTLTVRVGETIEAFQVILDKKPCRIRIDEVVMLVPRAESNGRPKR